MRVVTCDEMAVNTAIDRGDPVWSLHGDRCDRYLSTELDFEPGELTGMRLHRELEDIE